MILPLCSVESRAAEAARKPDIKRWKEAMAEAKMADEKNDPEKAFNAYVVALEESQAFTDKDLKLLQTADYAGYFFIRIRRYDLAIPLFQRAVKGANGPRKDQRVKQAIFLIPLGECYLYTDKLDECEKTFLESKAILEEYVSPYTPLLVLPLRGLGDVYIAKSRYSEAETVLKKALSIVEKPQVKSFVNRYGEAQMQKFRTNDEEIAQVQHALGHLYTLQKNYSEGEKYYLAAIKTIEHGFPKNSPSLALPLRSLGQNYAKTGKPQEAEKAWLRELSIEENSKAAYIAYIQTTSLLADLYIDQKAADKLSGLFEKTIAFQSKSTADEDLLLTFMEITAKNVADKKSWSKIYALHRGAISAAEKKFGKTRKVAPYLRLAAETAMKGNEEKAAEGYLMEQVSILESDPSTSALEMSAPIQKLGELYLKSNRYSDAEKCAGKQVALLEKKFGDADTRVANALDSQAEILDKLNNTDGAAQARKRSADIRTKAFTPSK